MSRPQVLPIRGYLIHITHYDPVWVARKAQEKPFDLKIGCEMVEAAARAGLNLLTIDLADGVAYQSLPELKRHYSIPIADLEALVACARDQGMEIVPKLNFSKSDHHQHNHWFRPYHELPDDEAYWAKAFTLIDEVIEICKPERFFFIGMDEDTARSDTEYVAVVQALHQGLSERELRTVMWNDTSHLSSSMFECVQKTLAAEDNTPSDIVHVLWDYRTVRARTVRRIQDMRAKGIEVWIAPGRSAELVRDWQQVALATGCEGLFMTAWRPVAEANREGFLDFIKNVGPVYANPVEADPKVDPAGPSALQVAQAPAGRAPAPMTDTILAPNHLGQPLGATPYLLPPEVYVRNWMLLGPFAFDPEKYAGEEQQAIIDDGSFVAGEEAELVAGEAGVEMHGVMWRRYEPPAAAPYPQVVDLAKIYDGQEYAVAYLVAHIHSDAEASDCSLLLGSDDYAKVWLNGQWVYTYNECTRAVEQDNDKVEGIRLQAGWNKLVVKCVNIKATWGLMLRIADHEDQPLVTQTA